MIRVLLVDDEALVRSGLRMMLEPEQDLEPGSSRNAGEDAAQTAPAAGMSAVHGLSRPAIASGSSGKTGSQKMGLSASVHHRTWPTCMTGHVGRDGVEVRNTRTRAHSRARASNTALPWWTSLISASSRSSE
jgi:hypothetical protein